MRAPYSLRVVSGSLAVKGRIALVQQQPWILGRTVRDNIVLGRGSQPLDVQCKG